MSMFITIWIISCQQELASVRVNVYRWNHWRHTTENARTTGTRVTVSIVRTPPFLGVLDPDFRGVVVGGFLVVGRFVVAGRFVVFFAATNGSTASPAGLNAPTVSPVSLASLNGPTASLAGLRRGSSGLSDLPKILLIIEPATNNVYIFKPAKLPWVVSRPGNIQGNLDKYVYLLFQFDCALAQGSASESKGDKLCAWAGIFRMDHTYNARESVTTTLTHNWTLWRH